MIKYIYWKEEAEGSYLKYDDMLDKCINLESVGYRRIEPTTLRTRAVRGTFSMSKRGDYYSLYVHQFDGALKMYFTNYKDYSKNDMPNKGKKAFDSVNTKFKDRTGFNITKAFGSVSEDFKTCVPRQFYYWDKNTYMHLHASCIDYCSQYPSNLCGRLPDAHAGSFMKVKGTVLPSEEYPFAFYLKSGHCAEYGVFDTHDWKKSLFQQALLGKKNDYNGDPFINPDKDVTVLMKASKFSFTDEMVYFYQQRKVDKVAKLVMNAFIGMLHKKNYRTHKQAHIAAIVIARSNDLMRRKCEEIGFDNIYHVCVDGVIYKGSDKYGKEEKALKQIHQEWNDCQVKIIGQNAYVAMKDGEVIDFKHGAYNKRKDGISIEICENMSTMEQWIRDDRLGGIIANGTKKKDSREEELL